MPRRLPAVREAELTPGESINIQDGREEYALFNVDGNWFACSGRCPHAGGPLYLGYIRGTQVICPWHGWSFELNCKGLDMRDGVDRYPVEIEDGQVYILVPGDVA